MLDLLGVPTQVGFTRKYGCIHDMKDNAKVQFYCVIVDFFIEVT